MNGLHELTEQASSVACILSPDGNKFHYVCDGQVSRKAHSKRLLQHDRTKHIDHIGDQFHTTHRHPEPVPISEFNRAQLLCLAWKAIVDSKCTHQADCSSSNSSGLNQNRWHK